MAVRDVIDQFVNLVSQCDYIRFVISVQTIFPIRLTLPSHLIKELPTRIGQTMSPFNGLHRIHILDNHLFQNNLAQFLTTDQFSEKIDIHVGVKHGRILHRLIGQEYTQW